MKKMYSLLIFATITLLTCLSCTKGETKSPFEFLPPKEPGVAAQVGDSKITDADLVKGIESDLYEVESKIYEMKFQRLKEILRDRVIQQDAKGKGMTSDQFLEKYVYKNITDKDVEAFIVDRKLPKDQITAEIKERIKSLIQAENNQKAADQWLDEQLQKTKVSVFFKKPERPVFQVEVGKAPLKGKLPAPVVLIEFSDFQCPHCAHGHEVIAELEKKYKDKLTIVFKNFPLPFHTQAKGAAMAGLCANDQSSDLFWKLHDYMFTHQANLAPEELIKQAKSLGLDEAKFQDCIKSNKFEAAVNQDLAQGQNIGVKSTPTFFVNGKLLMGAQPVEAFAEIIDEELAKIK